MNDFCLNINKFNIFPNFHGLFSFTILIFLIEPNKIFDNHKYVMNILHNSYFFKRLTLKVLEIIF